MNIRQLEYFLTVAECKSMTLAATTLGIAQPTLTKTVRALELELGVKLFERMPRGMELTPYGQSLLRHAEAIKVQFGDAKNEIEALRGGKVGTVTIGAGPAWLRRLLPAAVAKAAAKNPSIRVRIEGGFDDALLRALRHGEVDLVVAELPASDAARDLRMQPLSTDRLGVCCRKNHELTSRRNLAAPELLKYPWAMPPETTRAHQRLKALFTAMDLPSPKAVVETDSLAFLLQMARFSDALTFTVSTTLKLPEAVDLVMLKVPELDAFRSAGIVTRKDGWLSPAAEAIVEELVAICKQEPTN
ncbi:LysR family transcriptional regulator [Chelativorans xinjiangense]|uniref:LysR family transcriptional regulator n=1 Tax=Chelativorans xinjiangense TaxID=2681485 RepID=UPI00135BCFAD|nr:LysR family transcriptional regulator [Chelativorans xinjiangense]